MKLYNFKEKAEVVSLITSGVQSEVHVGAGYDSKELYELYKLGLKHGVKVSQCTQNVFVLRSSDEFNVIVKSLDLTKENIIFYDFELSEEQKNYLANLKCLKSLTTRLSLT